MSNAPLVRLAREDDLLDAGALLHDFNTEFGEPTPSAAFLSRRLGELIAAGDTLVLLAYAEATPSGLAVLRLRGAIWSGTLEAYLAELYVVPSARGHGTGHALMLATMQTAKDRGATSMEIGVDEPDAAARALYEKLGFSNRAGTNNDLMFVYEREL
jgi:GNAT superfamily N-acetyltransferase